ncbi:putative moz protein represents a chromatin-associated acetyltransferase [Diaporthe ampelina]|uniref:Putative moz protein represents a chromatin-associated acetyltransferase n=1 Tax=Diaporthe ampelina TaxID=1214573 RepID=A0A0G2FQZ8_9PEZI|nr:putative moz protein represents a chromatin-associated acetyltransferase [Diaporthe ampelina]
MTGSKQPLGKLQSAPVLESDMKGSAASSAGSSPPAKNGAGKTDIRESTPEQKKDAARALDPATDPPKETLSSPGVSSSDKAKEAGGPEAQDQEGAHKGKRASGPMDAVLHMEAPEKKEPEDKPPHLAPSPYVHHFDSYSLVKQLEVGGYTQTQAITAMKAVRALLAQHLDTAQGGLISKSDVENETYLFRAACAELSTEVKNNRRVADEQLRQQRTFLQHEVDNTTQALTQELATLNDNVKGMFNDRKMAVREEQKAAESATQQIAYKISVTLNSESKSEIEAVRWVLARRAVTGLFFMVTLSLLALRVSNAVSQKEKKEEEKEKEEAAAIKKNDGSRDVAPSPDAAEILAAN